MSLIDKAQEKKFSLPTREEEDSADKKLMQSADLLSIADDIISRNKISAKDRKAWGKHRKRLYDVYWPLGSLLGKATATNFAGIVAASLAHFEKSCKHTQPNGEWKICDHEADIRTMRGTERLVLAVQFVDALNKADLHYNNGQPSVNVNVTAPAIPDELVAALKGRGSGDDELKDLLKQFVGVMAKKEMSQAAPPAPAATAEEQA